MIFLLQTCYKRAANPVIFTRFSPVPPRFQGEKKNPGNVMFPGFACNFNNCSVISCVIPINACLTFGELRSSTGCLEAVFLTFFHSRVTGQITCSLENRSVFSVCFQKCSCNAMSDSACLSCISATFYIDKDIKFTVCLSSNQRLTNDHFQSL